MSLEDLEIKKHTQPIQEELDKQKEQNGILKTELAELRREKNEKFKDLEAAVHKYLVEAHAIGGQQSKISQNLVELRKAFGPPIATAWAMGTFFGPCSHGRDPYTRCDTCGDMEPFEAKMAVRNIGVAKAIETLTKALTTPSLWEKPKGPQGQDQYAGMPPAIRHVAAALTNLEVTEKDAVDWYHEERKRLAQQVRDRVRHELYGRFPNELVDKFIEKLDPSDLFGE